MKHGDYNLAHTNLYAYVQHLKTKKETYCDENGLLMLKLHTSFKVKSTIYFGDIEW